MVKILLFFLISFLFSCTTNSDLSNHAGDKIPAPTKNSVVSSQATEARITSLDATLHSNGTLLAARQQSLLFPVSGFLLLSHHRQGDRVKKGDLLFQLDQRELELQVRKLRSAYERAQINYQETLLGFGATGQSNDERGIQIRKNIALSSGLADAKLNLEEAENILDQTTLRAPFDGILANINAVPGNYIEANKPVATFYDPSSLVVKFRLPEASALAVQKGAKVNINPFFIESLRLSGQVIEVNPSVDENGMVELTAGSFTHKALLPGMNVEVEVKVPLPPTLIAPKEAVVFRSGRPVIFTYENGRAKWNYVKLGVENGKEVQVLEGLKEGDQIITTNIILLDHDSPVEIAGQTMEVTR